MERNTEKSTYEKQVKMICGYKKKLIHRRAFSLRLTRFERATPTSAGWCSNPTELQSLIKLNFNY